MRLSTDGQTFRVHKDILAYWLFYFSALFRGKLGDRDHVDFDGISAATLEEVVDFMYCGTYIYQGPQLDQLEDLQSAADYLGIESLMHQVEKEVGKRQFMQQEVR